MEIDIAEGKCTWEYAYSRAPINDDEVAIHVEYIIFLLKLFLRTHLPNRELYEVFETLSSAKFVSRSTARI